MMTCVNQDWNLGRYQWRVLLLHLFSTTICNFGFICIIFITPKVEHFCYEPSSSFQKLNSTQQRTVLRDSCTKPLVDFSVYKSEDIFISDFSTFNRTECIDGFEYGRTIFEYTATERFDLVCDRDWIRSFVFTAHALGQLVCSLCAGTLGDRYGRRPTLLVFLFLGSLSYLSLALVPEIFSFIFSRFLSGVCDLGILIISSIINTEFMKTEHRKVPRLLSIACMSFTASLFGVLVLYLNHYQYLLYFIASNYLLAAILGFSFYPESPRWLASQKRMKALTKLTAKISKINGECNLMEELNLENNGEMAFNQEDKIQNVTFFDLFRTPVLRKRTLVSCALYASAVLVWYAVVFGLQNFGPDIRVSLILSALMELPGTIFMFFTVDKMGRQVSGLCYLLLTGISCLAMAPLVSNTNSYLLTTFAVLGKTFACMELSIIFIHIPEIFPTACRGTAFGLASTVARISGLLAPQIMHLNAIWRPFSVVVLGLTGIFSGVLVPLLPDTTGLELVQTLEEGEEFCGKHGYRLVLPKKRMRPVNIDEVDI